MLKCLPYDYVELITKYLEELVTNRGLENAESTVITAGAVSFQVTVYPKEELVRLTDLDSRCVYTLTRHDTPLDIADMCDLKTILDYIESDLEITLIDWMMCFLDGREVYVGKLLNVYRNEDHLLAHALNGNTYQITADEIKVFKDCVIQPQPSSGYLGIAFHGESEISDIDEISGIDDSVYHYLQLLMNTENLTTHMSVSHAILLPVINLDIFNNHDSFRSYGVKVKLLKNTQELNIYINDVFHTKCLLTPSALGENHFHVEVTKGNASGKWVDYPLLKHMIETINTTIQVGVKIDDPVTPTGVGYESVTSESAEDINPDISILNSLPPSLLAAKYGNEERVGRGKRESKHDLIRLLLPYVDSEYDLVSLRTRNDVIWERLKSFDLTHQTTDGACLVNAGLNDSGQTVYKVFTSKWHITLAPTKSSVNSLYVKLCIASKDDIDDLRAIAAVVRKITNVINS